jgi:hypothetical protein
MNVIRRHRPGRSPLAGGMQTLVARATARAARALAARLRRAASDGGAVRARGAGASPDR